MAVIFGFLNNEKQKKVKAMLTTSIKTSIGAKAGVYNEQTWALMNVNETNLLLKLQNMKTLRKIKKRYPRHYRKYIESYEDDMAGG